MATLVLTLIGDDRAGLVSAVAAVLARHEANWERSQLAELAGKFAGIVEVRVPDGRLDELAAALRPLDGMLDIAVHRAGEASPEEAGSTAATEVVVELLGTDRPGLLRDMTATLADLGASITDLVTNTRDAPMSGGRLFEARVLATLPSGDEASLRRLRDALEQLAAELVVDLTVSSADDTWE